MADKKTAVDWERIESEYRAGVKSTREMASEHKISEGAIRKRAKRDDWSRDLSVKVRSKADALVRRALVRTEVRTETATENETVEVEAAVQARIRLGHRTDIARFRKLALSLLQELECETGDPALFEQLGDMLRSEDKNGQDKRNDIYRKVISSAGRVDSLKKLSETLKHLIGLEREAFGIGDGDKSPASSGAEFLRELVEHLPD